MKNLLENYLDYIHTEKDVLFSKWIGNSKLGKSKFASSALGKATVGTVGQSLNWGVFYIPATIMAWKAAKLAFSSATRKCGGIRANTPGFRVCVSKEKIKALEQRKTTSKKMLSGCGKASNPEICKEKFQLDIEKCNNRIEIEKNKIRETIGENKNLQQEFVGAIAGIAGMLVVDTAVNKALEVSLRTVQSVFSSAVRKCGVYKQGPEREICISKIKLNALTKKLGIYNRMLANCNKQKNPEDCKAKISEKLEKVNREIEIQKNNIIGYTKEAETAKREAEFKEEQKVQKKSNL